MAVADKIYFEPTLALAILQQIIGMSNAQLFTEVMQKGYQFKGEFVKIGCGILNGETVPETNVYLPLKTLNRHGYQRRPKWYCCRRNVE